MNSTPRHSPLEAAHLALGARLVEFGGWLLPVQYTAILEEHRAVRSGAGMFDISHMGEVRVSGPGALPWLESLLTNRVGKLALGRGQYTLLLEEGGGVLDDLLLYRTGEREYFLVINAACRDRDLAWMRGRLAAGGEGVLLSDLGDDYAAIALQGPDSERFLRLLRPECQVPRRNGIAPLPGYPGAVPALVARTGYTGEDGFELFVPAGCAEECWNALLALGVRPCGLGARDTLRLEMGYPLNGSDLSLQRTPLEAGLGKFVSLHDPEKPDFVGRRALLEAPPAVLLTAIRVTGQAPPMRPHYPVLAGGAPVGETTSGALSPSLGGGIALAYLPPALSAPGTPLEIEVRGRRHPATVATLPFYHRP
jgi:aminomethyltransferase